MTAISGELSARKQMKDDPDFSWKAKLPFIWKGEEIECNMADIKDVLGQEWVDSFRDPEYAVYPLTHATLPGKINYDGPIDFKAEIAKVQAAEPMVQLRWERNLHLEDSDWMAVGDRTMTKAQTDYRQALRDLPSTATPTLKEDGWIDDDSFDWPTKP